MREQARKTVASYDSDKEGRTLILEAKSRNEKTPWLALSSLVAGDVSYVWMLFAGTLPMTWLVAYPFLACGCKLTLSK